MERLAHLEAEVERLKSAAPNEAERALVFERLPDSATVGKDYVAYRFGCSERAVVRGEAGTHRLKRISQRPLKFIKREVDAAFREAMRPVAEKAAEARANARPVRRSIIKKRQ